MSRNQLPQSINNRNKDNLPEKMYKKTRRDS